MKNGDWYEYPTTGQGWRLLTSCTGQKVETREQQRESFDRSQGAGEERTESDREEIEGDLYIKWDRTPEGNINQQLGADGHP